MAVRRRHPPTSPPAIQERLAQDGYVVLRRAVDAPAAKAALRLLTLSIRRHGLTAEQVASWQGDTFFPHLRWEPQIWATLPPSAAELLGWQEGDEWAEPQLLLRLPDEDEPWPVQPHVDDPPSWATPQGYRGIVGVALTTAGPEDGTICVWPGSHAGRVEEPVLVPLKAGDALLMHPRLGHAGTLNLGAGIRAAIYFRLLAAMPANGRQHQ